MTDEERKRNDQSFLERADVQIITISLATVAASATVAHLLKAQEEVGEQVSKLIKKLF